MNKDLPLVSIVTPSYNQGRFIEDTLLSVKNQDYPNIEHIVIDNNSTDNTRKILKKYENEYNLKWISEPDEGQSDALNKGFGMAKGEIIGWLNSDDVYFDKKTFSDIVKAFKETEVDIVYGDCVMINKDNFIMQVCLVPDYRYERFLRYNCICQPATFFKKKIIENNKIDISLSYTMDYEFWLRLGRMYKFKHIHRIAACNRIHIEKKAFFDDTELKEEVSNLKKQYRLAFTSSLFDKLSLGYLRIKGIKTLLKLYNKTGFAINLKLNPIPRAIFNQIVKSGRELV